MKRLPSIIAAMMIVPMVHAISPIPQKTGLSGFVNLGAAVGPVESNTLSKIIGVDLGKEGVSSLNSSAASETALLPIVSGELSYTFAETGTQLFAGQLLEDYLTFDFSTRAGVRQQLGSAGIASVSVLGTGTPASVWNDPYVTKDVGSRKSTERTSTGVRLAWGDIMGSGLEINGSWRELDIDGEESGSALVASGDITATQQRLLRRDGDISNIELGYTFNLGVRRRLITSINYSDHDRDGEAMSWDGYSAEVNYMSVFNERWRLVSNLNYGKFEAKADNPIYDRAGDFDRFGVSVSAFYARPFELKNWTANFGLIYFKEDNDINFHDQSLKMVSVGMLYLF